MSEENTEAQVPSETPQFTLNVNLNERKYVFSCSQDSPLCDVYSAINQMKEWCEEKARESANKAAEIEEIQAESIDAEIVQE